MSTMKPYPENFEIEEPPRPRKKHGCLFYGCLVSLILLVVGLVAVYLIYRAIVGWVDQYADTQPRPVPTVQLPAAEKKELEKRVEEFQESAKEGDEPEELVLTGDEINALIARDPELKGHVRVAIEGDKVKGELSLGPIELPGAGKRFINGKGTFRVSLRNGTLDVRA